MTSASTLIYVAQSDRIVIAADVYKYERKRDGSGFTATLGSSKAIKCGPDVAIGLVGEGVEPILGPRPGAQLPVRHLLEAFCHKDVSAAKLECSDMPRLDRTKPTQSVESFAKWVAECWNPGEGAVAPPFLDLDVLYFRRWKDRAQDPTLTRCRIMPQSRSKEPCDTQDLNPEIVGQGTGRFAPADVTVFLNGEVGTIQRVLFGIDSLLRTSHAEDARRKLVGVAKGTTNGRPTADGDVSDEKLLQAYAAYVPANGQRPISLPDGTALSVNDLLRSLALDVDVRTPGSALALTLAQRLMQTQFEFLQYGSRLQRVLGMGVYNVNFVTRPLPPDIFTIEPLDLELSVVAPQ